MSKIRDMMDGVPKLEGKAINLVRAITERKKKISLFVSKYGRGDNGLTEDQKLARIDKFIGVPEEIEKVKGIGVNKSSGIELNNKLKFNKANINTETNTFHDPVDPELINNLDSYPKDMRAGSDQDLRIVYANVRDNGEMEIQHIHKDGLEHDPLRRSMSGVLVMDDYTSALNEVKQFKKGELKEVSDRTMAILEDEEVLDVFLENDSIDTDEDKSLQT